MVGSIIANVAGGFSLSTIDVVIISAAILGVVFIGLWASRKVEKTSNSYFLASGKMPWWLIGAAFVSTSVSSEQIVGTVGVAYENGMGVANWEWFALPIYSLSIVFFIPIYLRNRIMTVPEIFRRRFGPLCGDIYTWVMLFAYIFVFLVPVLYGGSLAFHRLTGWPFHVILWIIVLTVASYAIKGGLRSIMWADALQCLFLVGGGVLLFFLAMSHIDGGWQAMEAASPERMHLYQPMNDPVAPFAAIITATFGVFLFYQVTNQAMIQRVLTARSTWDGVMGIIFAGFINFLRPLVTCFLGLIVYHWIHHMGQAEPLANKDFAFSFALKTFAPQWGLRGIILAGFLAAVMSTASALINASSTIFTLDVYKKLINKNSSEAGLVLTGRLAAGIALVIAALCAPLVEKFGGIFQYFQTGVTYVATPFISVLILGIIWKRTNYAGAIFGLIGGFVITIGLASLFGALGLNLHWIYTAFIAQVLTMFGIVIVSLRTSPPPEEKWKPFYWRLSVLSHYDDGVKRPWYQYLRLWYGIYAVIWLYLYWRFW